MRLTNRSVSLPVVILLCCVVAWHLGAAEAAKSAAPAAGPQVTDGVAAGEVTATSAVIWTRCSQAGDMHLALPAQHGFRTAAMIPVVAADDFTGRIRLRDLIPDTSYHYRVWCTSGAVKGSGTPDVVKGAFRTAPAAGRAKAVALAWGGDLGGQNVCRDVDDGYAILRVIKQSGVDFFIGLGDMIYADSPCRAKGRFGNAQVPGPPRATDLSGFWAHWKYNRDDTALRELLAAMAYYPVWDDHEVYSDFGPHHDVGPTPPYPPGLHLMPIGLEAFLDYNPIIPGNDPPKRLYRSVRWGKHLEVFFLDTRQYRDANSQADNPEHPKTMLGARQRTWLEDGLQNSDATWKVIVSSVPMSVPTGSTERGRDGWANVDQNTGFEYELLGILRFLQQHGINNTLWITTDAHFGAVFRYTPFKNDASFHAYEVITGPMNAGVFPKQKFDTTLGTERLFLFGPAQPDKVQNFADERAFFNFGTIRISANGELQLGIVDVTGKTVYQLTVPRG